MCSLSFSLGHQILSSALKQISLQQKVLAINSDDVFAQISHIFCVQNLSDYTLLESSSNLNTPSRSVHGGHYLGTKGHVMPTLFPSDLSRSTVKIYQI